MSVSLVPYTEPPSLSPEKMERKLGFIGRVTEMIQAYRGSVPEDIIVPSDDEVLSRVGRRNVAFGAFAGLYNVSVNYARAVNDCRILAESHPVFVPIIRKLTRTV